LRAHDGVVLSEQKADLLDAFVGEGQLRGSEEPGFQACCFGHLEATRSGGADMCDAPLPPMGGEAQTGKADHNHCPDWRFRDRKRSNL
jgi:hypothetical protein